jgi:ABC-type maltose transport system permease subunit
MGIYFLNSILTVFPTLVVYLVLYQQVIKGLTAGSLKG